MAMEESGTHTYFRGSNRCLSCWPRDGRDDDDGGDDDDRSGSSGDDSSENAVAGNGYGGDDSSDNRSDNGFNINRQGYGGDDSSDNRSDNGFNINRQVAMESAGGRKVYFGGSNGNDRSDNSSSDNGFNIGDAHSRSDNDSNSDTAEAGGLRRFHCMLRASHRGHKDDDEDEDYYDSGDNNSDSSSSTSESETNSIENYDPNTFYIWDGESQTYVPTSSYLGKGLPPPTLRSELHLLLSNLVGKRYRQDQLKDILHHFDTWFDYDNDGTDRNISYDGGGLGSRNDNNRGLGRQFISFFTRCGGIECILELVSIYADDFTVTDAEDKEEIRHIVKKVFDVLAHYLSIVCHDSSNDGLENQEYLFLKIGLKEFNRICRAWGRTDFYFDTDMQLSIWSVLEKLAGPLSNCVFKVLKRWVL